MLSEENDDDVLYLEDGHFVSGQRTEDSSSHIILKQEMSLIDEASIIRPSIKSENGTIYKIDQILEPNKLSLTSKEGEKIQIESQSATNEYITSSPPA